MWLCSICGADRPIFINLSYVGRLWILFNTDGYNIVTTHVQYFGINPTKNGSGIAYDVSLLRTSLAETGVIDEDLPFPSLPSLATQAIGKCIKYRSECNIRSLIIPDVLSQKTIFTDIVSSQIF